MNMMKKNGGFTLVELIVVIAILAILAGVAVPAYSGYISKAQEAADYTWFDSAKTAIVFAVVEKYPSANVTGADITFGTNGAFTATADYTHNVDGTATDVDDEAVTITAYVGSTYTPKSGAASASWDGAKWTLTK